MIRTTLTVTLTAAITALALVLPAAGQPIRGTATVLKLDARFTYSQTAGRLEVATDRLSIGHSAVGHDIVACAKVTSTEFECTFTEFIAGQGTLQAEGFQGNTNAPVAIAIVGGTGAYTGASGTMTTSDENTSVEHYQLRYTLPTR
jgi:hypothetical protein